MRIGMDSRTLLTSYLHCGFESAARPNNGILSPAMVVPFIGVLFLAGTLRSVTVGQYLTAISWCVYMYREDSIHSTRYQVFAT